MKPQPWSQPPFLIQRSEDTQGIRAFQCAVKSRFHAPSVPAFVSHHSSATASLSIGSFHFNELSIHTRFRPPLSSHPTSKLTSGTVQRMGCLRLVCECKPSSGGVTPQSSFFVPSAAEWETTSSIGRDPDRHTNSTVVPRERHQPQRQRPDQMSCERTVHVWVPSGDDHTAYDLVEESRLFARVTLEVWANRLSAATTVARRLA